MFDKLFGEKHSIDRFVGGDKKRRAALAKEAESRFKGQKDSSIAKYERPKTPEELEMIAIVNRETDALREKYGVPAYEVPPENYHFVAEGAPLQYKREGKPAEPPNGYHDAGNQQIVMMKASKSKSQRLAVLFHETVHFKAYQSVDAEGPRLRRNGLGAAVGPEHVRAFEPLDEAVTEELSKRFMRSQEGLPLLSDETLRMEQGRKSFGGDAMEDVLSVQVTDAGEPDTVNVERTFFAYRKERQALHLLIDKLKDRNPKTFRDKDEWFDMFAGAAFNGHLLELARAVEGTFGKGKFRELGEQKTGEELLKFVESL